jgi:hypothetical protein
VVIPLLTCNYFNQYRLAMQKMFVSLLLALTSCAAVMHDLNQAEESRLKYCNYDGAFNLGQDEAKRGLPLDTHMATVHCDGKAKEDATKGYRDGYMAGKSR